MAPYKGIRYRLCIFSFMEHMFAYLNYIYNRTNDGDWIASQKPSSPERFWNLKLRKIDDGNAIGMKSMPFMHEGNG